MHWNTFLAVSSDITFKSSAKSGLSSAHSNNNSSGKQAGCCCRQEGGVQQGTAQGLQHTRQARAAPCPSCPFRQPDPHHAGCSPQPPCPCGLQSQRGCLVPVPWGQGRGRHWGSASCWRCQSVTSHRGRTLAWAWKFSLHASNCTSWKQFNLRPNNLF